MHSVMLFHFQILGAFVFFFLEPAPEQSPFKQGNDDEEDIREQNKNEGRNQDTGIFLAAEASFADKAAHSGKIKKYAQIEKQ